MLEAYCPSIASLSGGCTYQYLFKCKRKKRKKERKSILGRDKPWKYVQFCKIVSSWRSIFVFKKGEFAEQRPDQRGEKCKL